MTTNFANRRKNFYIKKEFQRNFILKFCALVVIGAVISGSIIYAVSTATVTTIFDNSRLTIKSTADYILPTVLLSSAVVVVLIGIASVIVTLFTSHKIAGPLYAIEKRVDAITALNLKTEFRLRAGDEIKPLAVGLDVMVTSLRNAVKDVSKSLSELEAEMAKPGSGASAGSMDKLKELRRKIEKFTA